MIRDLAEIIKKKGRSFSQIMMKCYGKLKPFLFLVSPSTYSNFKTNILRVVFKMFYSMEPSSLYDKNIKKGVNLIG